MLWVSWDGAVPCATECVQPRSFRRCLSTQLNLKFALNTSAAQITAESKDRYKAASEEATSTYIRFSNTRAVLPRYSRSTKPHTFNSFHLYGRQVSIVHTWLLFNSDVRLVLPHFSQVLNFRYKQSEYPSVESLLIESMRAAPMSTDIRVFCSLSISKISTTNFHNITLFSAIGSVFQTELFAANFVMGNTREFRYVKGPPQYT